MTTLPELLRRIDQQGGFLTEAELTSLAELDRLRQCLCRFNGGRFLCAAQSVAHFVGIIEHSKEDWLRDVSLPASDPIYRGDYTLNATAEIHKSSAVAPLPAAAPSMTFPRAACHFNEADCGGAFDGFQVTSDAAPGL